MKSGIKTGGALKDFFLPVCLKIFWEIYFCWDAVMKDRRFLKGSIASTKFSKVKEAWKGNRQQSLQW